VERLGGGLDAAHRAQLRRRGHGAAPSGAAQLGRDVLADGGNALEAAPAAAAVNAVAYPYMNELGSDAFRPYAVPDAPLSHARPGCNTRSRIRLKAYAMLADRDLRSVLVNPG
jgi:hypothetical protein